MQFPYHNATVRVSFRYPRNRSTVCWLTIELGGQVWAYHGEAWCVDKQFVKETGRKIALRRALEASKGDKQFRTEVWNRYHMRGMSIEDSAALSLLFAIVPEAGYVSFEEAAKLLDERLAAAAEQLEMDFKEV